MILWEGWEESLELANHIGEMGGGGEEKGGGEGGGKGKWGGGGLKEANYIGEVCQYVCVGGGDRRRGLVGGRKASYMGMCVEGVGEWTDGVKGGMI